MDETTDITRSVEGWKKVVDFLQEVDMPEAASVMYLKIAERLPIPWEPGYQLTLSFTNSERDQVFVDLIRVAEMFENRDETGGGNA